MLSLILPTFNEAKNLGTLLPRIDETLRNIPHEIIVVDDDSPDGTWRTAEELQRKFSGLVVLRRIGRRGLSSAVIEGFSRARGSVLAAMDADGQHDIALLPQLYAAVSENAGIALGSRYISGGSTGEWNEKRRMLSRLGTVLARFLCRVSVSDPMSGFFAIDAQLFRKIAPTLHPKGFKILLDLLVHAPRGTRTVELPFTFGKRLFGQSKLSPKVQMQFLSYVYDVTLGKRISLGGIVFAVTVLALFFPFAKQAWNLRWLYLDPTVRASVERTLTRTADEQGWLLSDTSLLRVTEDSVEFLYRPHVRGADPDGECYAVAFSSPELLTKCRDS